MSVNQRDLPAAFGVGRPPNGLYIAKRNDTHAGSHRAAAFHVYRYR